MAIVSTVDIVSGLDEKYWSNLTPQDRFFLSRVRKKITLFSRKRKKGLTQKSLLPQVAEAWNLLSDAVKLDWKNAGAECNLNGYRLFVQDKCARIVNDLSGNATPSLLHQSWVGQLHIEDPASELKITQLHPKFYYVYKKVAGTKSQYSPVKIDESFALPLTISLNYKSELESISGNPAILGVCILGDFFLGDEFGVGDAFVKFYADVWSLYQGQDITTRLEIDLDLVSDWKNAEAVLSSVIGQVVGYNLFIHLYNVRGELYIDNVHATHSAQNWARDPFCKDINQGFTRAFYQIPKHWAAVTAPDGTWYESIYKDF
jgi:hypothetical protein